MITFIKYSLSDYGLKIYKCDKFFEADNIISHNGFIVIYPKLKIVDNKVIYENYNKIGFYCKTLCWKDILKFKGGFNIEKCSKKEWQIIGRKWYVKNKIKLPRKLKKNIIGKIE